MEQQLQRHLEQEIALKEEIPELKREVWDMTCCQWTVLMTSIKSCCRDDDDVCAITSALWCAVLLSVE